MGVSDISLLLIGLADSGKLYFVCCSSVSPKTTTTLTLNATSFTLASNFVIFTTTAHEVAFIPLTSLIKAESDYTEERRRLERGSRIVAAVPSTMSLVLQMPRGNLETLNPRPLVMSMVKRDLET
jgi:elongator complex protein 1